MVSNNAVFRKIGFIIIGFNDETNFNMLMQSGKGVNMHLIK